MSRRSGSRSSAFSSVVLPAPRKPVSRVSGIGGGGSARSGRSQSPRGGLRRALAPVALRSPRRWDRASSSRPSSPAASVPQPAAGSGLRRRSRGLWPPAYAGGACAAAGVNAPGRGAFGVAAKPCAGAVRLRAADRGRRLRQRSADRGCGSGVVATLLLLLRFLGRPFCGSCSRHRALGRAEEHLDRSAWAGCNLRAAPTAWCWRCAGSTASRPAASSGRGRGAARPAPASSSRSSDSRGRTLALLAADLVAQIRRRGVDRPQACRRFQSKA